MGKRKYYMTLDTETCTLPFVKKIAGSAEEVKKIAIAKPIVYDIGWVIAQRDGKVIKEKNYLVQETFFVPEVFNTAYYAEKRPIYISLLKEGKISAKLWNDIVKELLEDLHTVEITTAYNACFDFKKAIPFTESYIRALYSDNYQKWENNQKQKCKGILKGTESPENSEYLKPYFKLRGEKFPLCDLWGESCGRLGNGYKEYCLKNGKISNSGIYFSTSAESVFSYYTRNAHFVEDHTALSDAKIENEILKRLLHDKKVTERIAPFPFRDLGRGLYCLVRKAL